MTTAPFGTFASGKKVAYNPDTHDAFVAAGPVERTASIIRAVIGAILIDGHTVHLIDVTRHGRDVAFASRHLASTVTDIDGAQTLIDSTVAEIRHRRDTPDRTRDDLFLAILGADALLPDPAHDDNRTLAAKHSISVNLGLIGVTGGQYGIHLILTAEEETKLHRFPGAPFPSITAHMNDVDATTYDGVEDVTFAPVKPDPATLREALLTFLPPLDA